MKQRERKVGDSEIDMHEIEIHEIDMHEIAIHQIEMREIEMREIEMREIEMVRCWLAGRRMFDQGWTEIGRRSYKLNLVVTSYGS